MSLLKKLDKKCIWNFILPHKKWFVLAGFGPYFVEFLLHTYWHFFVGCFQPTHSYISRPCLHPFIALIQEMRPRETGDHWYRRTYGREAIFWLMSFMVICLSWWSYQRSIALKIQVGKAVSVWYENSHMLWALYIPYKGWSVLMLCHNLCHGVFQRKFYHFLAILKGIMWTSFSKNINYFLGVSYLDAVLTY